MAKKLVSTALGRIVELLMRVDGAWQLGMAGWDFGSRAY
jgi:hypothetical protein